MAKAQEHLDNGRLSVGEELLKEVVPGSNQAAELLETHSFSLTFLMNMKHGVIDAMRHRDDENDLQQLKQTAGTV